MNAIPTQNHEVKVSLAEIMIPPELNTPIEHIDWFMYEPSLVDLHELRFPNTQPPNHWEIYDRTHQITVDYTIPEAPIQPESSIVWHPSWMYHFSIQRWTAELRWSISGDLELNDYYEDEHGPHPTQQVLDEVNRFANEMIPIIREAFANIFRDEHGKLELASVNKGITFSLLHFRDHDCDVSCMIDVVLQIALIEFYDPNIDEDIPFWREPFSINEILMAMYLRAGRYYDDLIQKLDLIARVYYEAYKAGMELGNIQGQNRVARGIRQWLDIP